CGRVSVVTTHERRRFVEHVDFITSPGWLRGGATRAEAGLAFGGVAEIITDLGRIVFDPSDRHAVLAAIHPGSTADRVRAMTGFALDTAATLEHPAPPRHRGRRWLVRARVGRGRRRLRGPGPRARPQHRAHPPPLDRASAHMEGRRARPAGRGHDAAPAAAARPPDPHRWLRRSRA